MTDDINRLKQALDATRPGLESEPDREVRRQAMDAALRAFDEENAPAAQGSAAMERQNGGRANLLARLFGGKSMNIPALKIPALNIPPLNLPSLKPLLMGSASVAVIAVAVLATRDLSNKDQMVPLPAPIELTTEAEKSAAAGTYELKRTDPLGPVAPGDSLSRGDLADVRTGAAGNAAFRVISPRTFLNLPSKRIL